MGIVPADLATHASLTGHLVFSSIHTNNAIGVIPRLVDLGVASFLVPSAVIMAVGQRLVRRLCSYCKVPSAAPPVLSDIIKNEIKRMSEEARFAYGVKLRDSYETWAAPGCDKCSRKGTLGRIGIFEVLSMTKELKDIVYGKPTESNIKEEATRQGMITMRQDGIIKALAGMISIEEVLRVTEE
jgi:type II secretory ATPase GspE/PulE/Tfp pilus assembly ATPase PilB-like protein